MVVLPGMEPIPYWRAMEGLKEVKSIYRSFKGINISLAVTLLSKERIILENKLGNSDLEYRELSL